jgi:hypothetical protein
MHFTTIHILFIVAIILVFYLMTKSNESYGPYMNRACETYNCSNPEEIVKAVRQCKDDFSKEPDFIKSGCDNPDPEIRKMTCVETCDPQEVPNYILEGNKQATTCVPGTEVTRNGIVYCKNQLGVYIYKEKVKESFRF